VEGDVGSRDSTLSLFDVNGISTKSFESAEKFLTMRPIGCIVTDLVSPGMSGLERK
jgi:FixJ family two-component response regulator